MQVSSVAGSLLGCHVSSAKNLAVNNKLRDHSVFISLMS